MEQQEAPTSRPSRSSANRADAFAMVRLTTPLTNHLAPSVGVMSASLLQDNRKREATSRSSASSSTSSSSATTSTTTSSKRPSLSEAVTPPDSGVGSSARSPENLPPASTRNPPSLKPPGFFGRLRLFSLSNDRPRSNADNPRAASSLSVHEPQHCSPDDLNPHLLPKSRHAVSSRLEFTGKSILSGKYSKLMDLPKPRTRRLSGHYRGGDAGPPLSPNDVAPDFARSCPDRDSMTCLGLMGELMSAVDILSARQNQWCSSGDAKNTIQVLKAAQSSTLLFVRKSVDEPDEDAGRPTDLHYFDEDTACSVFFKHSTCYDVLPESGKLLVLDSTLPIRRAMQALTDHSLAAAPVWCSRLQCYTHLLTTDLSLRLLAQAFPLQSPPSAPHNGGPLDDDAAADAKISDPKVSMGYWEGKTMGSVLKTFYSWARTESSDVLMEAPTVVTPQDHLHRITRILTLAFEVPTTCASSPASEKMEDVCYTPDTLTDSSDPPSPVESTFHRQYVAPPRHILIADKVGTGNLLGVLNSDRLLAYLRVRMRNLPTPSTLKVSVGDLQGIRWEERGWQLDNASVNFNTGALNRVVSSMGSAFYLHPSTTCLQALHILNAAWSKAGLACLPVSFDNGQGFQGMLSKHDILGTIFAGPLDIALSASVGTILSVRPRAPGYSNQAMCFTSECLVAVLDRMFRQKAPCLAVFEKPGSGASWDGQAALGAAVGVITSCDLLHTIVLACNSPSNPTTPEIDETLPYRPGSVKVSFPSGRRVLHSQLSFPRGTMKRNSLPCAGAAKLVASSVPAPQITSPLGSRQHTLTRFFHRHKRYSESEVSPLEGPFATHSGANRHHLRNPPPPSAVDDRSLHHTSRCHGADRSAKSASHGVMPKLHLPDKGEEEESTLFEMDELV
uniref:CBS domain-containing protein n=1 Tax=Mesocestoides corti TaxID=53468 RepID=A0A5K3EUL0_MESCO